jgi:hypothetical protein
MPKRNSKKKMGRRKLSNYNRIQQEVWKIYRNKGIKPTFKDAAKEISLIYKEFKKLPLEQQSFTSPSQREALVEGLYKYYKQPKVQFDTDIQWFKAPDYFATLSQIIPSTKVKVIADDSKGLGEQFELTTTVEDFFIDFKNSQLYKYLNTNKEFRKSKSIPEFKLINQDDNNEVTYEIDFDFDFEFTPTEQKSSNANTNNQSEKVKLATIQLELEKEKNKTIELYTNLYKEGIISKDELRKKLGF